MLTTDNKIVAEIIKHMDEKKFNQAEKLIDELNLSVRNIVENLQSADLHMYKDIMAYTIREALFMAKFELKAYAELSGKDVRSIDHMLGAIMANEYDSLFFLGTFNVSYFLNNILDKSLKKAIGVKTTKEYTDFVYSTLKDMKHKKVLPWMITQIMV